MSCSQQKLFHHQKINKKAIKMGFLYEKGNVGYEKSVGFAIKDPGLSPRSATHLSCSNRKVSGP